MSDIYISQDGQATVDLQSYSDKYDKRIAELEAQLAEAQKDAERFKALQDMDPKKAQAFFWNYTSRKQRAKAIDEAMEKK